MSQLVVDVAPFVAAPGVYTYEVPAELGGTIRPGCRVVVSLLSRQAVGVVTEVRTATPEDTSRDLKPVVDLLDEQPVLEPDLLDFVLWMARYYLAAPGEALRTALPGPLHARERQLLRLTPEGERVLSAQEAVLRSVDDDIGPRERRLLELLRDGGGALTLNQLHREGAVGTALGRLVGRGLVAQSAQRQTPAKPHTDLLLELLEPVDLERLGRARRQVALVETLRQAGGRARLGELSGRSKDARALAHKLAARGVLRVEVLEVPRDPFAAEPVEIDRPPQLTDEQQAALDALLAASERGEFVSFLLHGVTGSGKTEVYLRLIARVLERGRDALVLVPEISLTPQLAARFRARFGNQVAVLHSGLTDAERFGQWRLIRSAGVRIVVGARSAIFAPLRNIGAVIVDEEHDPSFKQEEGVRYNARDLALVRAQRARAVAVLGSATPSLESYYRVEEGRVQLLNLRRRATPRPLPEVQVVDLRRYRTGPDGVLTAPLADAIEATLEQREQTILFLNRRGFSTFVLCKICGHAFRCVHCSVTLTYHRNAEQLICHYCGYAIPRPTRCPACSGEAIGLLGLGTEKVEEFLRERFVGARVARLDRDTASGRGLRTILAQVGRREVDILVGTQMVTKGHDFPHVTLVGVISADQGLHFPDFRASERTFQLLTQVAGRAGRGDRPGRVVIQTYSPEHPSLIAAQAHDYEAFYRQEIEGRRELGYPPCAHLASLRLDGEDAAAVATAAHELAADGHRLLGDSRDVTLLGPTEAPIQRLKGRTRWLLVAKASSRAPLRRLLEALSDGRRRGARVTVDVDPLLML
jgi:primosomal protein N' (replication factor Y) (superfamily II helicase)